MLKQIVQNNQSFIDISSVRQNLSSLINSIYSSDKSYIITKRNIPVAKLTSIKSKPQTLNIKKKKLAMELFGVLKNDKRTTLEIAQDLKKNLWRGV